MGKLSIQDLAAILIAKNGLEKEEAKRFVAAIFDVIQAGIEKDKLVKVKGLGTFKVIDVDARESVNVNTGSRVLIDSHSKITFVPDTTMKELVNKPFSGFETVVLNEGVEFDDMPVQVAPEKDKEIDVSEVAQEIDKIEVSETKITESIDQQISDIPTEEQTKEHSIEPKEDNERERGEEIKEEQLEEKTIEHLEDLPQEHNDDEVPSSHWWQWGLVLILGLLIGFATGFYVGKKGLSLCLGIQITGSQQKEQPLMVADTLKEDHMIDTAMVESLPIAEDTLTTTDAQEKDSVVTVNDEMEPDYKKYEAIDSRVRTGAYYIVGTDREVEAREGDSVERVSRRYLGEGMSCYVEVYNGMSGNTILKAGQKVKIPKLRLKKYLKKN